MLSRITLKDFKCFDDVVFSAAPLTLFTGTNSVGKSTVIQALLLMRIACMRSKAGSSALPLNGPFGLSLGQFEDVLRHNLDAEAQEILIGVVEEGIDYQMVLNGEANRYAHFTLRGGQAPIAFSNEGLGQFVYLSSDRFGPRNTSPIQSLPKEQLVIGHRGEHIADVLYWCERDEVKKELEHSSAPGQRFLKQVEAWLSSFVPGVEIRVELSGDMDLAALRFIRGRVSSEWDRPSNTGFGVSYCLPIIVAGLSAKKGSVLIIESPEAHMHPSAQSAMGSFLGRLAASGIQVLIETHSDHILNGIRKAVVDAVHPLGREHVVMNHLTIRDDELVKEEIRITEAGSLTARPPEFFDQAEIDLGAIVKSRFPSKR